MQYISRAIRGLNLLCGLNQEQRIRHQEHYAVSKDDKYAAQQSNLVPVVVSGGL